MLTTKEIKVLTKEDVMAIHRCGTSTAYKLIKKFKMTLNKPKNEYYFYHEYLQFIGIKKNDKQQYSKAT